MHIGRCVRYKNDGSTTNCSVSLVTLTDAREHMRPYRQITDAILAMAFWQIIGTGQIKEAV
jgi:hypothetical protein